MGLDKKIEDVANLIEENARGVQYKHQLREQVKQFRDKFRNRLVTTNLSYQQQVLFAALRLAEQYPGQKGYEFHMAGDDLILTPWHDIFGRGRTYSKPLWVSRKNICGSDETLVGELENMLKEMKGFRP